MKNCLISPFRDFFLDKSVPSDVVFFSFLVVLLPVFLITGPAVPDIFLSLVACYFLIKSIKHKLWNYYKNPIVIGFLFFCVYGILRSLFYDNPWQSLSNEGSIFFFRYIFFVLGVWYLLNHNPYLPKCLLIISMICLVLVSFDGFYQYIMEYNILGNSKYSANRLTGFFGDEPIIGRYIAYLSMLSFALIYNTFAKTKKMMMFSIIILVISEMIVFLSGERSPLLYLFLFSILILIFIPSFRIYRLVGILASILLIYCILEINPIAKQRMFNYTINQISQTKLPYLPYSPHHEEHYISSIKMFIDKPIFGIGTNTFRFQCQKSEYKYKERSCSSHPHNYYIQTLAELGIIGFLFLSIFYFYLCFFVIRQLYFILISEKQKLIPFESFLYLLILVINWWPLIPHMSLYNNWNNVFMMLPLAFLMKYLYKDKLDGNIKLI